jgi:Tfp pilus assembly protein PilX
MSNHTKLLCLFLRAQKINKSSEQGYAMAMVSLLSIILFSLLAASLVFSNLAKSRTDAFVDGTSAFAVAESGLNKRAIDLQSKLDTYSGLAKSSTPVGDLKNCFSVAIDPDKGESISSETDDFECRNYSFNSSNNAAQVASAGGISLDSGAAGKNNYVAYTLVTDKTRYGVGGLSPDATRIPATEPFGGLNAAEYKYVVESVAKKPIDSDTVSLPNYTAGEIAALDRQQREQPQNAGDDDLLKSVNDKRNTLAAGNSSSNATLSMSFVTRVVPLFQFGIFYNGDLEFNSTSQMRVQGRVHSNANIYIQPAGVGGADDANSVTTFLARVSAARNIYNRVDAWDKGIDRKGITRILVTGNVCDTEANCPSFPAYSSTFTDPLRVRTFLSDPFSTVAIPAPTAADSSVNNVIQDGASGAIELKTPLPGFTRKRNYFDNKIGIYYSRADMRLEFVPDRDVTARPSSAAWTRNQAIIPFNFTSITTSGSTCSKALPTAGSDPAPNYIDPSREKVSTRRCNTFTKGQLQSLRQPVLVLTKTAHSANPVLETIEDTILERPTGATDPTALTLLTNTAFTNVTSLGNPAKDKILRALQVALVSTPEPVTFDRLNKGFSDPIYGDSSNIDGDDTIVCTGVCESKLNPFKTEFKRLVKTIFPVVNPVSPSATDITNIGIRNTLFAASPSQIAALRDAWFLPAPIQRVEKTNGATAENPRSSGFYDSREQRWISMLQTNIASLSVWNRDGLYVIDDTTITSPYVASTTNRNLAFNDLTTENYSTRGLAFDRSAVDATKTTLISTAIPAVLTTVANLKSLGLGSTDTTEGGLVVHATVSDDLDGNGVMNSNDVSINKTNDDNRVLKKKPNSTNELDRNGNVIITDYYRNYPGQSIKQSPFAFAFSGGNYLPNALMLSSDQSVYIQGNFNNNANNTLALMPNNDINRISDDRLAASVVADTITALSNECVDKDFSPINGVPGMQLRCGVRIDNTTIPQVTTNPTPDDVRSSMAINAAFLSNTDTSTGNYSVDPEAPPQPAIAARRFSGGVNNYIRLLENWGNQYALNYTGSMVSLGAPLEYSGLYKSGGGDLTTRDSGDSPYYNIPFRNFNYDTKFDRNESVPPLTPKASYVKQSNFNRVY